MHQNLSSLKTEKDIYACLESFKLFSINGSARNQINHRFTAGVHWASTCYYGFTMATRTEEIGRAKPAKRSRKDTSTPFKRTLPCCLTFPLAVYAKTLSSSSIRDRFLKSAFRPKDQELHTTPPTRHRSGHPQWHVTRKDARTSALTNAVSLLDATKFLMWSSLNIAQPSVLAFGTGRCCWGVELVDPPFEVM